jgi:lauroyl/myristoyl acyltransferase
VKSKNEKIFFPFDLIAFALSKIEKKSKFQKIPRYILAKKNLEVILKREVTEEEIDSVFFFHTLYLVQLITFKPLMKYGAEIITDEKEEKNLLYQIRNKGVICVSAHLGIPESASILFTEKGAEIFVLVENLKSKIQNIFFSRTRKSFGLNPLTSFKKMVEEIKSGSRNKIFVFLVDRPIPNSKDIEIFGEKSKMTDLPFRLSSKFNLKVFGVSAVRDSKLKIPPRTSVSNWKIKLKIREIESFRDMVRFIEREIYENYVEWNPFFIFPFTKICQE